MHASYEHPKHTKTTTSNLPKFNKAKSYIKDDNEIIPFRRLYHENIKNAYKLVKSNSYHKLNKHKVKRSQLEQQILHYEVDTIDYKYSPSHIPKAQGFSSFAHDTLIDILTSSLKQLKVDKVIDNANTLVSSVAETVGEMHYRISVYEILTHLTLTLATCIVNGFSTFNIITQLTQFLLSTKLFLPTVVESVISTIRKLFLCDNFALPVAQSDFGSCLDWFKTFDIAKHLLPVSKICGIMFVMFFTVVTASVPNLSTIAGFMKQFTAVGGLFRAGTNIWTALSSSIEFAANYVYKACTGMDLTNEDPERFLPGLQKWLEDVGRVSANSNTEKFATDEEVCREVEILYFQGLGFQENISGLLGANKTLGNAAMNAIRLHFNIIKQLYERVDRSGTAARNSRMEPILIEFAGVPGSGKSCSAQLLAAAMVGFSGRQGGWGANVYPRQAEMGFWTSYRGQIVVLYDDFDQVVDSISRPNAEIMELIRLKNIAPFDTDQAALEEKGKWPFTSRVVIVTSNSLEHNPVSIRYPGALKRRFDLRFRCYANPQYSVDPTNADKDISERVDKLKLPRDPDGSIPPLFRFSSLYEIEYNGVLEKDITFDRVLEICKAEYTSHFKNATKVNEVLKNIIETERLAYNNAHPVTQGLILPNTPFLDKIIKDESIKSQGAFDIPEYPPPLDIPNLETEEDFEYDSDDSSVSESDLPSPLFDESDSDSDLPNFPGLPNNFFSSVSELTIHERMDQFYHAVFANPRPISPIQLEFPVEAQGNCMSNSNNDESDTESLSEDECTEILTTKDGIKVELSSTSSSMFITKFENYYIEPLAGADCFSTLVMNCLRTAIPTENFSALPFLFSYLCTEFCRPHVPFFDVMPRAQGDDAAEEFYDIGVAPLSPTMINNGEGIVFTEQQIELMTSYLLSDLHCTEFYNVATGSMEEQFLIDMRELTRIEESVKPIDVLQHFHNVGWLLAPKVVSPLLIAQQKSIKIAMYSFEKFKKAYEAFISNPMYLFLLAIPACLTAVGIYLSFTQPKSKKCYNSTIYSKTEFNSEWSNIDLCESGCVRCDFARELISEHDLEDIMNPSVVLKRSTFFFLIFRKYRGMGIDKLKTTLKNYDNFCPAYNALHVDNCICPCFESFASGDQKTNSPPKIRVEALFGPCQLKPLCKLDSNSINETNVHKFFSAMCCVNCNDCYQIKQILIQKNLNTHFFDFSNPKSDVPFVREMFIEQKKFFESKSGDFITSKPNTLKVESHISGDMITQRSPTLKVEASPPRASTKAFNQICQISNEGNKEFISSIPNSEALTDSNTDEIISHKVAKNLYRANVSNTWINILFVKGRIAITSAHQVHIWKQEMDRGIKEMLIFNVWHPSGLKFNLNDLEFIVDKNRDISLIVFPPYIHTHTNIVHHFVERFDQSNMSHSKGTLLTLRSYGTTPQILSFAHFNLHDCQPFDTDIQYQLPDTTTQHVRQFYSYTAETKAGDCGSPLLLHDPTKPRKIFAIHSAGAKGAGYAVSVTQEYLNSKINSLPAIANVEIRFPQELIETIEFDVNMIENTTPIGKILTVPGCNAKSSIVPSKIFEQLTPIITKPAILHPKVIDNVLVDPMIKGLRNVGLPTKLVDTKLLNIVDNDVKNVFGINKMNKFCRTLTYEEAITGVNGEEYLAPINRRSSPGYPWVLKRKGIGKTMWLGEDDYILDNAELKNAVMDRINSAKKNIRIPCLWIDTLKDERRELQKVNELKTRVFSAGSQDYVLATRMYFLGFAAHVMHNKIENECAIGINPYSFEWTKLARYLQCVGNRVIAGDFSRYDTSLSAQILWRILHIINDWYDDGEENRQIRTILFEEMVNSFHLCHGNVYQWTHSQPSGNALTVIINSIYNMYAMRLCWLKIFKTVPSLFGLNNFRKYVKFISYGDDNCANISAEVTDYFNQQTITEAMDTIGLTYTDEHKSATIVPYRTLEEIDFLKRGFLFNEEFKYFAAPLKLSVCFEMMNWIRTGSDPFVATTENILNALVEISAHGEDIYESTVTKLRKITSCFRNPPNYVTYDEQMMFYLSQRTC